MKVLLIAMLVFFLTGCSQSDSRQPGAGVYEFHMAVMLDTDDSGGVNQGMDGLHGGKCHLQSRLIKDQAVSHPILESKTLSFHPSERQVCLFDYTLPFGFCALTSSDDAINCKITRDREPGWVAELSFQNPGSSHLLCTVACFDRVER